MEVWGFSKMVQNNATIEKLKEKYKDAIPGKVEFVYHILDTATTKTNESLTDMNMKSFSYYSHNRDKYPEEFKEAFFIFEFHVSDLIEKIKNEIIEGFYNC